MYVGVVYDDQGKEIFSKGILKNVTNSNIIILFMGQITAISFDSITKIKEMRNDYD
jgi:hypothetical protein